MIIIWVARGYLYKGILFVINMLTIGIDDAGRGPVIGPMIMAGVVLDDTGLKFLKKYGSLDSKEVLHPKRVEIEKVIKEVAVGWHVVKASPEEIDKALASDKMNLNRLEAMKMASVINELNVNYDLNNDNTENRSSLSSKFSKKGKKVSGEKMKVMVDCPSINIEKWQDMLEEYIENIDNLTIVCEHKADANHLVVGAASILAKVMREEEVSKIKSEYGDTGSGYPSDPYTVRFLKEKGKEFSDSGIFRKSWATWRKMYPGDAVVNTKGGQATLEGF